VAQQKLCVWVRGKGCGWQMRRVNGTTDGPAGIQAALSCQGCATRRLELEDKEHALAVSAASVLPVILLLRGPHQLQAWATPAAGRHVLHSPAAQAAHAPLKSRVLRTRSRIFSLS